MLEITAAEPVPNPVLLFDLSAKQVILKFSPVVTLKLFNCVPFEVVVLIKIL